MTIVAGLARGLQRTASARCAFSLALPATAGVAVIALLVLWQQRWAGEDGLVLAAVVVAVGLVRRSLRIPPGGPLC